MNDREAIDFVVLDVLATGPTRQESSRIVEAATRYEQLREIAAAGRLPEEIRRHVLLLTSLEYLTDELFAGRHGATGYRITEKGRQRHAELMGRYSRVPPDK